MKIIIEELQDDEEEQIIIKCREMTAEILRILALLKAQDTFVAYDGNVIYRIKPAGIYYIDVVDNKTFIYSKDKVYESKQKLYEWEESLANRDFIRVSKSVLLNISKIKSLSPALSGRFEALLDNGDRIIISRQYMGDLKKRLGL